MAASTTLLIKLRADGKQAVNEFKKVEGGIKKLQGGVSRAAKLGGVALAGMAAAGIREFAQFERGMNEVFTLLPGISGAAMDKMSGQVRDLAVDMGVLPDDVVPALYQSLSAGVPQGNVFEFLGTATELSIAGVTDLETAVDGLTTITNAYGIENVSAGEAADSLFTAMKQGKTTVEEMSSSLFQVVPAAAAAGINIDTVGAALAAITAQGTPTRVAATQLRQAIVELGKSGSIAFKAFEDAAGTTFPKFIEGGGTIQEALGLMAEAAAGSGGSISDSFGSVEAGMAALTLTGDTGAAAWGANMDEMNKKSGAVATGFATMDKGIARTWDRIKAKISDALIGIGEQLAPLVETFLDDFGDKIPAVAEGLAGAFGTLVETIGRVGAGFGIVKDFVEDLPGPAKDAALAIGGITAALLLMTANPILAAIGVVAFTLDAIGSNSREAARLTGGLVDEISALGDEAAVLNAVMKVQDLDKFTDALGRMGLGTDDVVAAVLAGPDAIEAFKDELAAAKDEGTLALAEFGAMEIVLDSLSGGFDDATSAISAAAEAERRAGDEAQFAEQQMRQAASAATSALVPAMEETDDAATGAGDAIASVADEALKLASPAFAAADAVRDLAEMLKEIDEDGERTTEELRRLWEQQLRTNAAMEAFDATDMDGQLRLVMEALGLSRQAAQDFLVELGLLEAQDIAIPVVFDVAPLPFFKFPSVNVPVRFAPQGQPMLHAGGVVPGSPGQTVSALLKAGETVLPTHLPGRSGGGDVTVNVEGFLGSEDELVDAVRRGMLLADSRGNAGISV